MGDHENKNTEEHIPLKVWKMTTPDARIDMRFGKEVKIVLVKDRAAKTIKHGGGKIPQQQNMDRDKFLRINQSEGKKNDALYLKIVDKFITECGGTS